MTKDLSLTRRGLIGGAAAAGALSGLPMPAIGQGRGKLSVQGFGGAYEKILRESVIPEFQKLYPYDVTLTIEDDTTLLPKLRIARNRAPYDVCTVDNSIAVAGQALGVWAPDQSAKMKNAPDVYKSSMPPKTANYGSIVYEYALVHDKQKLPNPQSWKDLWQPGLVIGVPHVTQSYGLTFLYIAAMLHGGDEKNLDPGFAAIKALPKFKVYKNVSEGLNLFQQKEVDAALFYGHRGQQIIDMGLPYAKAHPKEGTWGQRTGTQIPKATSNLDGAIAWVDYTLSVPYQTAFAPGLYSPTNSKVVLPPELAAKHVMGAQTVENLREVDWAVLLPQRDALIEKWTREIG
uniref:Extracellular solute-binding protein n=1 Tax=Bosea sp. NBC_00436 TaxID=2969620 RepID=A0A9E7ZNZ7_9HYPH